MSARRCDTVDKYQIILEAAVRVFSRNGFFESKLSEIACEAGVAKGTIGLYFDNKDDLILSVLEVKMKELLGHIQGTISETDDAIEQFECLVDTYLEAFQANPDLAAVLQVELRPSSRFMHGYKNVELRQFLDLIGRIVERGQREGVIRANIPLELVKCFVFGTLDEVVSTWVMAGKQYRLESLAEPIFELFLRGIGEPMFPSKPQTGEDRREQ